MVVESVVALVTMLCAPAALPEARWQIDSAAIQFAAARRIASQSGRRARVVFDRRVLVTENIPLSTPVREHSSRLLAQIARATDWRVVAYGDVMRCDSGPRPTCRMVGADLYLAATEIRLTPSGAEVEVHTYTPSGSDRVPREGIGYRVLLRQEHDRWTVVSVTTVWQT